MLNRNKNRFLHAMFVLCLALGYADGAYASEEDAKLKELERAMITPGGKDGQPQRKLLPRAIVFDAEPGASQNTANNDRQQSLGVPCNALPPETKYIGVDFSIRFKSGSAEVSLESDGVLRNIAGILSLNTERCVIVEGHTDSIGRSDTNMMLSQARAESVVQRLVEHHGLDKTRLVAVGKGQNESLPGLDPRNAKNRRVVFKVAVDSPTRTNSQ